jgi:Lon protease-like protein
MAAFPMFPLGTVLFPSTLLPLRVFEERYLAMLGDILVDEPSEFGVVLIERGPEVGGGERRFSIGTVAEVTELDAEEDFVVLVGAGTRRFEVTQWLDDSPYPQAEVRELDELVWDESLRPLRLQAEDVVCSLFGLASRLAGEDWSAGLELADDPVASSWQLAAIAPLGPLDQVELLASTDLTTLLTRLIELVRGAEESFRALYPDQD